MTKEAAIRSIRRRMALTKAAQWWSPVGGAIDGVRGVPAGTTAQQIYQGATRMGTNVAGAAQRAWGGIQTAGKALARTVPGSFMPSRSASTPSMGGMRGVTGGATGAAAAPQKRPAGAPAAGAPAPAPQARGINVQVR